MKNISPFAAQKVLFRAYDIRGAQPYFTESFVQALAQVFAQLYITQNYDLKEFTTEVYEDHDQKDYPHSNKPSYLNTKAATVIIGYDVRYSSDSIAQTLASILQTSGVKVIELGLVTTPMMAFWAQQYEGHGIMVTASHSSKETLGIKWLVNNTSPSSSEIQALYQQVSAFDLSAASNVSNLDTHKPTIQKIATKIPPLELTASNTSAIATSISLPADTIASTYIDAITQAMLTIHSSDKSVANPNRYKNDPLLHNVSKPTLNLKTKLDLTLVIDCLNGATSNIAQPLFERFCQRVIMLNDHPDGSFPTGNPDPTEPNRLAELQQTVIVNAADMGLAFDGDGDRLMIVDNSGKVVTPDHLLYLLAQVAITERPMVSDTDDMDNVNNTLTAPPVLFDIKCSHHVAKLLTGLGAKPIITRTGSSLLRQRLQTDQQQAIFAGELSGHFIFNDGYFIVYDDAMYAGLRLLHWLAFTAVPTSAQTDKIMLTTDLWGELRSVLPPYDLTDITQSLPTLISTADHYLPLPSPKSCEISVLGHLIAYCHYLQCLGVEPNSKKMVDSTVMDSTVTSHLASLKSSALCDCFNPDANASTETNQPIYNVTIEQAQQLLPVGTQISLIDGIRLDFANGFGVLRESNTSHSLTVRFAGDSLTDLKEVQARFVALCELFDNTLAEKIAAIRPE